MKNAAQDVAEDVTQDVAEDMLGATQGAHRGTRHFPAAEPTPNTRVPSPAASVVTREGQDKHMKDVAQGVADDALSAAEDGGIKVFIVARATFPNTRVPPPTLALGRRVKDGHMKDAAQDVAEDALGAAENGSVRAFSCDARHLSAAEPTPNIRPPPRCPWATCEGRPREKRGAGRGGGRGGGRSTERGAAFGGPCGAGPPCHASTTAATAFAQLATC